MPERLAPASEKIARNEIGREDWRTSEPPRAREPIQENTVVAERPLPSVKDLLPPLNWSSSNSSTTARVSLNTNDPIYISYFNKIKQMIESRWVYPQLALDYRLEGTLYVEFTITATGQLEDLRMVKSSGYHLLDEEALRALKAAAPFPPIPPWIKQKSLTVSAPMIYHDGRPVNLYSR